MYAVIRTGGKQYRVSEGDVLRVELLDAEAGAEVQFDQVLMLGEGADVTVGTPLVEGGVVTGTVREHGRAKKVHIIKFRRRKHHMKRQGHRQHYSEVEITGIGTGGAKKPAKKAAPAKKPAAKPAAAAPLKFMDAPQGEADDLKQISGVGPVLEGKLHALGIYHFSQIAAFSADDIANVDTELNFKGRIERDNWLEQAKALAEAK